jgi:hypothetical protein
MRQDLSLPVSAERSTSYDRTHSSGPMSTLSSGQQGVADDSSSAQNTERGFSGAMSGAMSGGIHPPTDAGTLSSHDGHGPGSQSLNSQDNLIERHSSRPSTSGFHTLSGPSAPSPIAAGSSPSAMIVTLASSVPLGTSWQMSPMNTSYSSGAGRRLRVQVPPLIIPRSPKASSPTLRSSSEWDRPFSAKGSSSTAVHRHHGSGGASSSSALSPSQAAAARLAVEVLSPGIRELSKKKGSGRPRTAQGSEITSSSKVMVGPQMLIGMPTWSFNCYHQHWQISFECYKMW